ncbi:TetR/AcrR family transcriptional regulator [Nocardia panacis]|uniref:TetR/AcrR family transcriptional regulator n=1 Tax=Nocardia panacis TaxID=2340916 RepID=A0A3A4K4M2_9NOCA|nr:TetR/AcrR family transcriptional regulator [Nocardia panacis]RJO73341.1 TetR/AcrR family transcriptional regulator [Nocardia panacis]
MTTAHQTATVARKKQITGAAITLLGEIGYQATTLEAICKEAGLSSKRLITYHFSSKDDLFAAVADQIATDAETSVRSAFETATGARELLATVIRANVEFIADHLPQVRALQQILLNGDHGVWERHHVESLNGLARLFEQGQRTGAFRPFDAKVMAAALRASIDSMVPLLSTGLDPDQCGNELVELFDHATSALTRA